MTEEQAPEEGQPADASQRGAEGTGEGSGGGTDEGSNGDGDVTEQVTTSYETLPGGGHRVTRRTVRRRVETEHVEEEVTEDLPAHAYTAPATPEHPAPVG